MRERNLDHAAFEPIYEAAAALGCPLYIHPQMPPQPVIDSYYAGFSAKADLILATGAVGWHYETGIQLLRLILSGVFDRYPKLQMITGHWGEVVLFYLERVDLLERARLGLQRPIKDYFRQNLFYTAERHLQSAVPAENNRHRGCRANHVLAGLPISSCDGQGSAKISDEFWPFGSQSGSDRS